MKNKDPDFMHWIAGAAAGLLLLIIMGLLP